MTPEDFLDVRRLGIHVGLPISRETRGQDALQVGELACGLGMGPEIVAKGDIVAPQRTAFFNQVHVVRPRLAPAKELSARNASLAAVVVTGLLESGNVVLGRCIAGPARRYVENRLGAHTRDRGTTDVFESQRQRATLVAYPLLFSGEERRPASVVLDEADDARFKTESVRHRCSVGPTSAASGAHDKRLVRGARSPAGAAHRHHASAGGDFGLATS
jgi:hypothetical protein